MDAKRRHKSLVASQASSQPCHPEFLRAAPLLDYAIKKRDSTLRGADLKLRHVCETDPRLRQRTSYPQPFKAQVVQECLQTGVSIASVALRHGINANLVRKWIPVYRDRQAPTLPPFCSDKANARSLPRQASLRQYQGSFWPAKNHCGVAILRSCWVRPLCS